MVLTPQICYRHIEHVLGGDLSELLDPSQILRGAGELFVSLHKWSWLQGRSICVDIPGPLSGATADYTASTKRLVQTGAFATYTWVEGDKIKFTGAGVPAVSEGSHVIARKVGADELELETGPSTVDATTLPWSIARSRVPLPPIVAQVIDAEPTDSSTYGLTFLTSESINQYRTAIGQNITNYWYASVVQAPHDLAGGNVGLAVELWPAPSATIANGLTLFVRKGWDHPQTDTTKLKVPEWIEPLFLQVLRAYALGFEADEIDTVDVRIERLRNSRMFMEMTRRDGSVQPYTGLIRGGHVMGYDTLAMNARLAYPVGGPVNSTASGGGDTGDGGDGGDGGTPTLATFYLPIFDSSGALKVSLLGDLTSDSIAVTLSDGSASALPIFGGDTSPYIQVTDSDGTSRQLALTEQPNA